MSSPEYAPTFLGPPAGWKLVDVKTGSFYRTKPHEEGPSCSFDGPDEAIDFAKQKGLPLVDHLQDGEG